MELQSKTMGALGRLQLRGVIDHSFKIDIQASPIRKEIQVECRDIQRINSDGIRAWARQFSRLRQSGIALYFFGLPPSLVDLIRYIPGLVQRHEVVSIQLPFRCPPCDREFVVMQGVSKASSFKKAVDRDCPTCSRKLVFDDQPEGYRFLLENPPQTGVAA
jgi:hypothetical protein